MINLFDYLLYHKSYEKKDNNKGATMVIAIVIMSILVIFTFSLALVAYTLYASQNKNAASMKCSEAANTLNRAMEFELTKTDGDPLDDPVYQSYFYKYVRYNICQENTWPYYNPSEAGHTKEYAFRYYDLKYNPDKPIYDEMGNELLNDDGSNKTLNSSGVEGMPGRTELCIYWKLPEGITSSDNLSGALEDRNGVRLVVEITCESASQTYSVASEYYLTVIPYDLTTTFGRDRADTLVSELIYNDPSINPQGISIESINKNEEWVWTRIAGD